MNGPFESDPQMRAGLALLLKARAYARDVHENEWQFAVEIDRLISAGMSICDLRWLQCKGLIEHAVELTQPGKSLRRFGPLGGLMFEPQSCMVLTRAGEEHARQALGWQAELRAGCVPESNGAAIALKPFWDPVRQELLLGDTVVKQFKAPAENQALILCAFQEEEWPLRIDDPLPPQGDLDSKRRLHDTINALNRNQLRRLLRFSGDGRGLGVLWHIHEAHERPTP